MATVCSRTLFPSPGLVSPGRGLFALFVVSCFNYIDRTILAILQIPIKQELGLTDGQIGALTGLAFAIFYSSFSLPIARLADRMSRRLLIVAALIVWSSMTAMSGLAVGFASLLFFRIGVAIGESGSVPASVSIIADLYPPSSRARAMSMFGLALPVGVMFGYLSTGWLASTFDWRVTFAIVGGVGIILAPAILWLLREPACGVPADGATDASGLSFFRSLAFLWRHRAFRFTLIAAMLHGFTQYSIMNWSAPFFTRSHGLTLKEVALLMAMLSGLGGAAGIYLGGVLGDIFARKGEVGRVLVMGATVGLTVPLALAQFLVPSLWLSIVFAAFASTLVVAYYGPVLAVTQGLVPGHMRAFSNAVLLLVFNLFGLGLGPWLTGLASDLLQAQGAGAESLRYALCLALAPSALSALMFTYAARLVGRHEMTPTQP